MALSISCLPRNPTASWKSCTHASPPGTYSQQSYSHEGEEAGYLLSGSFELWVGERHFQLGEGDSFSFSSQEPHRYGNPGEVDAVVIWVITPPTF
ncbi:hypothetical protein PPTS312_28000 [Pseudomonas putida]|uniref:Cupin type-2 domain-containing protein n=1 Tax=Pseudomonas putida TaxID=303 RepID=A0A7U6M2U4_PSEPU|nr:hypothetical protein PPTS312_28000 [Pseudomonas putida]